MTGRDPDEVIGEAERRTEAISQHAMPAFEWFLANDGLHPREDAIQDLARHLDVEDEIAGAVVGHLVSDEVDPVQQVVQPPNERYVGVIDHTAHDWFYAYDRYDDVEGRQRRAVCGHCVQEELPAAAVTHLTRKPENYNQERAEVALGLHYQVDHQGRALVDVLEDIMSIDTASFADRYGFAGPNAVSLGDVTRRLDTDPALRDSLNEAVGRLSIPEIDVKPGASLVAGTTIGANEAWHAGNDGTGSGLDADAVDGMDASQLGNLIERDRSGNAYIQYQTSTWEIESTFTTNETRTAQLTPTQSWDVGFLDYSLYDQMQLTKFKRGSGATTVTPTRHDVNVRNIGASEIFTFYVTATTTLNGIISATFRAGQFVS